MNDNKAMAIIAISIACMFVGVAISRSFVDVKKEEYKIKQIELQILQYTVDNENN